MKRLRALRWPADRWLGAVDFLEHGNVPDDLSRSQANGSSGHLVLWPHDAPGDSRARTAGGADSRVERSEDQPLLQRLARGALGITKAMVREFVKNQEVQQIQERSVPEKRPCVVKPLRPEHPRSTGGNRTWST